MTPTLESDRPPAVQAPRDTAEQAPRDASDGVVLTPEQAKSRRARNIAIGVVVALLVALVYILTIVKLGSHVGDRVI